jgi:hypothetical protein
MQCFIDRPGLVRVVFSQTTAAAVAGSIISLNTRASARITAWRSKNINPINQDFFAMTRIEQNSPLVDSYAYETTNGNS